ncbi:DUF4253 domain-containing protein [Actinosynnema sp. NPDC051121]
MDHDVPQARLGGRVVDVGEEAALVLSVASPPTTHEAALAVAAEHFASCPDNVWGESSLARYAERLIGDHSWTSWRYLAAGRTSVSAGDHRLGSRRVRWSARLAGGDRRAGSRRAPAGVAA